jgi:glycosyltransferase involved in cell wall biosynthesis
MNDVTIVLPAYNEEDALGKVLKELKQKAKGFSVLVVDDGSTDRTSEIAKKARVRLVRHPYNKGYGAALKTGAKEAKTEYVLYFDADGQFYADDIKKVAFERQKYDMIIGARPKELTVKDMGRRIMKATASYLSGKKIPDLNCGFRLVRRQRVLDYLHILPDGFSLTTTITLAMLQAGDSVKFAPVRVRTREAGKSGIKSGRHFAKFMLYILRMIMLFNPLKVFLPASMIMFAIGFPAFLYYLILQFHVSQTSLMIMLFSLLTFLFGLVADTVALLARRSR